MHIRDLVKQLETKDRDLSVRVLIEDQTYDIADVAIALDPSGPEAFYLITIIDTSSRPEDDG